MGSWRWSGGGGTHDMTTPCTHDQPVYHHRLAETNGDMHGSSPHQQRATPTGCGRLCADGITESTCAPQHVRGEGSGREVVWCETRSPPEALSDRHTVQHRTFAFDSAAVVCRFATMAAQPGGADSSERIPARCVTSACMTCRADTRSSAARRSERSLLHAPDGQAVRLFPAVLLAELDRVAVAHAGEWARDADQRLHRVPDGPWARAWHQPVPSMDIARKHMVTH
jgi:hypothetical protein